MRRVLAAIIAFVMVLIGSLVLVQYVQDADNRAIANQSPTQLLIVQKPIPKGTKGSELGDSVALMKVPQYAAASDALSSIDMVRDLVASTDLIPGEQLLQGRFVSPEDVAGNGDVPTPKGMVEVSLILTSDKARGGLIQPGDYLGLVASTEVEAVTGEDGQVTVPAEGTATPGAVTSEVVVKGVATHMFINKALVVRVEGSVLPSTAPTATEGPTAPTEVQETALMLTLALSAPDAEKLIWTLSGGGTLYTVYVNNDTKLEGIRIVNRGNIFQ